MSITPVVKYRKDYQSPSFNIEKTNLNIDLYDDHALVTGVLTMKRVNDVTANLSLDGELLQLQAVYLNDEKLEEGRFRAHEAGLDIIDPPSNFTLKTICKIEPQNNKKLMGLYRSGGNFCTQCESEGFRRITYYLDRPDALSVFTTRITADKAKYPILLANGNQIESGDLPEGRHFAVWQDPFLKPCYLFAMVAGDLAMLEDRFTTMSGRNVTLRIFAAHEKISQCDFAMEALKKSMRWDEEVYGREYDLDIFMIVAVNDFNFGAMENKGLNVFNDRFILARPDTATDNDYAAIDAVVAHEYFHNWSGNRVTVRDWFQLSLKEGLTVFRDHSYSEDVGLKDAVRIAQVKALRSLQFPEDSGPLAHPIRPDSYIEMSNFYTATVYEKGSEVIRMMRTLLGAEKYRKATDLYFSKNDGKAITCEDFVLAMEEAGDIDLKQFRLWYSQAGTPVVTVTDEYDEKNQRYTLHMKQVVPVTPGQNDKKAMLIPVVTALFGVNGEKLVDDTTLELTRASQSFVFEHCQTKPVPSLLRGFSAPIKLHYDYTDEDLLHLVKFDDDGFARYEAIQHYYKKHLMLAIQNESYIIPNALFETLSRLIEDAATDPALLALMIALPSEDDLHDMQNVIDVKATHRARKTLKKAIADKLSGVIRRRYEDCRNDEPYHYNVSQVSKRSLKNVLLGFIDDSHAAFEQFQSATNMTDQFAALNAILKHDNAQSAEVIKAFHDQWQNEALVMDKWFAAQAMADVPKAIDHVKALMNHPLFNIENPNKVRSLVLSFAKFNPVHFHCDEGYALLRDVVMKVDAFNPMVAARIMQPLSQWRRYDEKHQAGMKAALEAILNREGVSKDVYEIASKSLA